MVDMGLFCVEFGVLVGWNTGLGRAKESEWVFGMCGFWGTCVESFFASLKKEKIYRRKYDTMEKVKKDVFWYIELFYNRRRRHSSLEYMTPVEYLRRYDEMKVA